jgi:hypothetical protein
MWWIGIAVLLVLVLMIVAVIWSVQSGFWDSINLSCDHNHEKHGALCYPKCPAGMSRRSDRITLCGQECPPGTKYHGAVGCIRSSSAIGVGTIPTECPSGWKAEGALCYPFAEPNEDKIGLLYYTKCPPGMINSGFDCWTDTYGRGAGFPWRASDGATDNGMFARCEAKHGSGNCEKYGAIVYPKCRPGYKNDGCCICRAIKPDCNSIPGLRSSGVLSCNRIPRARAISKTCTSDKFNVSGLCYKCYKGTGVTCQQCPDGKIRSGLLCYADCQGMKHTDTHCMPREIDTGVGTPMVSRSSIKGSQ